MTFLTLEEEAQAPKPLSNYGRLAQLVARNTECPDGHGTLADCGCHGEIRKLMRSFYDEHEDDGMLACLAAMCEPDAKARQTAFDNICQQSSTNALAWIHTNSRDAQIEAEAEKAVEHVIDYLTSLPARVAFRAQHLLFSTADETCGNPS